MLAPGIRPGFHVPRLVLSVAIVLLALLVGIGAWVVTSPARVSTDGPAIPALPAEAIRSVAYFEPDPAARIDRLLVRPAEPGAQPRVVAAFPYSFTGLHARGFAAPTGDLVAVLSADGSRGVAAVLSLVSLDGTVREVPGDYDYLSRVAWSADGSRLAVVAAGYDGAFRVVEVVPATGEPRTVAEFSSAFQVAPIGYSLDRSRLFIVVVDQSGSNLWMVRGERSERLAELSPGRTRDWALSPDGSRVAFVDILSASSRTYVGKTLTIATGSVTAQPAGRNQVGAVWQPGNPLPLFGGPGGSLQLADPSPSAAWVIPMGFAPLGDYLVIATMGSSSDGGAPASALWLATASHRELITEQPAASFVGWVKGTP